MENTNDIKSVTSAILETSENSIQDILSGDSSGSSSDGGFLEGLKNLSFTTWLLIIIILAFLGFNIFVYLASGTQQLTDIFGPFINKIFGFFGGTAGQVVDVSAEGAKAVVGTSANIINSGLTSVQNITPNKATSSVPSVPVSQNQPDIMANNTLNKALNTSQSKKNSKNDYTADEASSNIQGVPKSGWCYIGEDRGFRSCAKVGLNDKCMSGDIFPSQEICINPSLRA